MTQDIGSATVSGPYVYPQIFQQWSLGQVAVGPGET